MEKFEVSAGSPLEQGAVCLNGGVNFCIFSRNANHIFVELFGNIEDKKPFQTIELDPQQNRTGDLWHVFVKGLGEGALYLLRADGPFEPENGHRFDSQKFLFDPRAKAFTKGSWFKDEMPKCVVVDDNSFDWEGDRPLNIPLSRSVIYEMHAKGFTASGTSDCKWAGTYRGLTEKIPYLKNLGITAVELLPVHYFDENENPNINPLTKKRVVNYWGYSTIGFFAPKTSYASDQTPGNEVKEFKQMVKELHKAGIEVILDVVYNHTAEGNEQGPTMNFKGLDNSIYYHLPAEHPEYYMNFSGCGNAMNCNHPVVADFIVDSLRYWVLQMHVDGFRFDLASILTRGENGFIDQNNALTRKIAEDPVLRNTKMIAEPWDCGGGYQVGNFPGGRWCEWNDKFRDGIRKFIRGDEFTSTEAATRISGSSDLYSLSGRKPYNSINFVTAHDGFTLNDLVSYNGKHNEANGEDNRDGNDNNLSWNCGVEGITDNEKILRLRKMQMKNFFTTLLLSQGTPMFVAGDEVCRTQGGNNNPYCQDNELSYFNWKDVECNQAMFHFVKTLIELRKNHRVLSRNEFFTGAKTDISPADITWFGLDGQNPDWSKLNRFLALRLGGGAGDSTLEEDNDFYIAFNTDNFDRTITIPVSTVGTKWYRVVDTSIDDENAALTPGNEEELFNQQKYVILAGSAIVLMSK